MKDLIGKLGESIKNTCKEAVDQTQKTVDQTKYRSEIASLKGDVKKLYQRLGQEYYHNTINNKDEPCSIPTCNRITSILREIERLEKRIDTVVTTQKDSFDSYKREVRTMWNEEMEKAGFVQRDENGVEILKFCLKCDIGNAHNAVYCINCGNKF